MKKSIYYSMIVLAGLFLTNACSKDKPIVPIDPTEESEGITLPETISVTIPDNLTRVSLTQDEDVDGSVKLAWDEDDMIYVAGHGDNETWITYAIDTPLGENPHVATFSKVGEETITAESFDILYGAPTLTMAESIDFSVQTQEGNASTGNLQYMALISGVNTVENVQFTSDWASANGGSFKQTGVVRLRLQMPTNVTAVSSVFLAASLAVFNTTNKLDAKTDMIKVNFTSDVNIADDNNIVTVYASLPWADVSVPGGNDLTAVVKASDGYYISKAISNASGFTFSTGSVNAVKLSRSGFGIFAGGSGVDGDPYTIASKWHMMNTKPRTVANAGSVTYFKLLNDIDMSGLYWIPLNNVASNNQYTQYINFDGNNCTISNLATDPNKVPDYPSLFGVLQGSVKNLTIDRATITPGSKKSGVFAGYIGTGTDYTGNKIVSNVHVTNSTVTGGTNYCGGFAAQMNRDGYSITNCSVEDTDVASTGYAAGFIAYLGKAATVSDIVVKGTNVTSTGYANGSNIPTDGFAGGIAARVAAVVDFDRCYYQKNTTTNRTATLTGPKNDDSANGNKSRFVGGIVAYVDNVAATFDDCHVNTITLALNAAGSNNNGRYMGGAFGYLGASVTVGNTTSCSVEGLSGTYTTNHIRNYVGGFIGFNDGGTIKNCSAAGSITGRGGCGGFVAYAKGGTFSNNSTSVAINGVGNLGGFVGITETTGPSFTNCVASGDVNASGSYSGGFVGNSGKGNYSSCSASGNLTSTVTYCGGFAGIITEGILTKCSASGSVSITGANFAGGFVASVNGETQITKSKATGNVKGNSTVGGFVAYVQSGANLTIQNCYSLGNLSNNVRRRGGLIAWVEAGSATIDNCYATGTIDGVYEMGGLIGLISVQTVTMRNCAAWNSRITATQLAANNWSTGAIVGVSFPTCTLTNNYRNPNMSLTAYWIPDNSYQHANVSQEHPLVLQNGSETTASSPVSGQDGYPRWPYHGKCEPGKTLSQLASSTLGWSSDVWNFTGDLPTLN